MANTRFKGANASERLTLSTLSDSDMFQTRHLPGTVNDADKGVSKALLQALPIAVCATAAATAAKVGTLAPESCPDFTLVNGRVIHVYFSAANTASVPTINVAGTGAIPITYPNGDFIGAWAAGTTMDLMYISITDGNTAIERWVVISSLPVDEVTADNMHSVTSNAVAKKFEQRNIYGYTETKTANGWDYLVNLGVLKGKYAIMIFNQGASLYAIGSTSTTYESGYTANNVTVLRVITFPDNNTEDIFASGYISPQGEISFNVIAFKVM